MVVVTNLNRRLNSPAEKAVREGKPVAKFITGPRSSRPRQDFFTPDPFLGKFDENIRSDDFYKEFPFDSAQDAQAKIDFLQNFGGNTFSDPNISARVDSFMSKYDGIYGPNTTEAKGLVEPDRIVKPENLSQLSSSPASSGSGFADPNVTGQFPSNSVAV